MSDSRRTYRAIKNAILQLYPTEPQGNLARHLTTLVGLVSGIVLSKSCQLPQIASKVPGEVHPDSRTKQFSRWVNNEAITFDLYFLPFLEPLLAKLAAIRPLVLVMDGSAVARGCVTLMVSVLYGGRALPIAWLVIAGAKGHFPAETHVTLLREVKPRIPAGATVGLLGDRADGKDADAPLFTDRYDHPLNKNSLRLAIARLGKNAGVKHCHPHRFRHTFAITYLRSGGDVFTLQSLLGHSTLDMVQHYARIAEIDVEQAHKRASPADNWRL